MAPRLLSVASCAIVVALAVEQGSSDSCTSEDLPTCRSEVAKENVFFQAKAYISKSMPHPQLTEWHVPLDSLDEAADELLLGSARAPGLSGQAYSLAAAGKLADANMDGRLSAEELLDFARAQRAAERRIHVRASWEALAAREHLSFDDLVSALPTLDSLEDLRRLRFRAADGDGDGKLTLSEYHGYVHPSADDAVFAADRDFHFARFDQDSSGGVDYEEFKQEARASSAATGEEFSKEEDAAVDFRLHDSDSDGALSVGEFGSMLRGDERLHDAIRATIESVDKDGDLQIHLQEELLVAMERLLDNEFVEDFLLTSRLQEL